jgi:hypothetical protein
MSITRFFSDWGLKELKPGHFECLNGCEVRLLPKDHPSLPPAMEPGSTLREVVWGMDDADALLARSDPNGLALSFRKSRKRNIVAPGAPANGWDLHARVDRPAPVYAPREFTPSPENFAEWAITGGIDGAPLAMMWEP